MGSVKDLEVLKKPTREKMGVARFHFSDRYSVFDWGRMPDLIEGKGAALCLMGAYSFEKLEERGVRTHYRGVVTPEGKVVRTDELEEPVNIMEIDLVNVYRPKPYRERGRLRYDYSIFTPDLKNFLVPLEIIYRNGLPEGSSVFKRLEQGLKPEDLGLDHYPKPGEKLERPIFDVSTKLEEKDRYVTWSEAQRIAGLTDREVSEIKEKLLEIDNLITEIAARAGLENEDGKVEFAFDDERRLMVADVVGTLDECRFTFEGLHVSKEVARQYYRRTEWYRDVERAKREADAKGVKDWRSLCKSKPPRLDPQMKRILCNIYKSAANEYTGLYLFDAPSLAETLKEYREYRERVLEGSSPRA
ncbi:phosphoribosylaminoimidazolesuccinocarboxamide synthase [Candidatus Bathyarchaeota archaeon]|nr:MAG: phosphoribosylaminoimidazolesuccinocarboxamide synthase [Candidatus Bathyarchaeota archaeon ex4484_40]RJS67704.1 MAG: phosphoribosylaminoimidazolesuccinocarboxamide synthase [Candidatus Bathyarchaeota archaeon]RJS79605.1 MAG: phosphoribosylaminoimidazolesuccinocarboxamide synthase [Candidatus Bathyarchaeota archaeon]